MDIFWYLPTQGDERYLGTARGRRQPTFDYLRQVVVEREFRTGGFPTSFLGRVRYQPRAFEVLDPGMQTTVQDHPGRTGFWHVGVPPSGPMDPLAFRLVNRLVGNPDDAAGLECTMTGPRLRFFQRNLVVAIGVEALDHELGALFRRRLLPGGECGGDEAGKSDAGCDDAEDESVLAHVGSFQ